jgi:hypothetical protein
MQTRSPFSRNQTSRITMLAVMASLALIASACGASAANPPVANPPASAPTAGTVADTPVPALVSSPTSPAAAADACTLLTNDEVGGVLGLTVDSATSSGLGGVCTYIASNLSFDLTVSNTGGIQFMQQTLTNLGDLALLVPGLGDQAFFNTNTATLFVLKGDAVYLFNISDSNYQMTQEAKQPLQKGLAEKLVNKLP